MAVVSPHVMHAKGATGSVAQQETNAQHIAQAKHAIAEAAIGWAGAQRGGLVVVAAGDWNGQVSHTEVAYESPGGETTQQVCRCPEAVTQYGKAMAVDGVVAFEAQRPPHSDASAPPLSVSAVDILHAHDVA